MRHADDVLPHAAGGEQDRLRDPTPREPAVGHDPEPARIDEDTRFREDLEADSLDLYTLVQELEDSYGVKMSDEQAARIHTVRQAIDFVLAHEPSNP